jgi:thiamine pyrophosphate-dependent acetolactate synthase large subunit-like protein
MSEATKMPQDPDQIVDVLAAAGVKRVYGVVGDYRKGLTEAIRRQGKIECVHVRNEEAGAMAAGAEAHLKNELAVCAGTCRPGKPVMSGRDDSLIDLARTNLRH